MEAPFHVGIIPDGNRRWARRNGVPLHTAYRRGYENLIRVIEALDERGAGFVTVYAMSRDNCTRRPSPEIAVLKALAREAFTRLLNEEKVRSGRLRVMVLGDYESFDSEVASLARRVMRESRWGGPRTLTILFCYSGSWEASSSLRTGTVPSSLLHLPPLDLVIRTGGYSRLSGFLPFLADYTEMYVTGTLWPDFGEEELDRALEWYRSLPRNFGR